MLTSNWPLVKRGAWRLRSTLTVRTWLRERAGVPPSRASTRTCHSSNRVNASFRSLHARHKKHCCRCARGKHLQSSRPRSQARSSGCPAPRLRPGCSRRSMPPRCRRQRSRIYINEHDCLHAYMSNASVRAYSTYRIVHVAKTCEIYCIAKNICR